MGSRSIPVTSARRNLTRGTLSTTTNVFIQVEHFTISTHVPLSLTSSLYIRREAIPLPLTRVRDDLRTEDGLQDPRQEETQHRDHDLSSQPRLSSERGQSGPAQPLSETGAAAHPGASPTTGSSTSNTTKHPGSVCLSFILPS